MVKARGRLPIVYHRFNVSINEPSLTIQLRQFDSDQKTMEAANVSNVVLLARHGQLPTLDACDMVKRARDIVGRDGNCVPTDGKPMFEELKILD